MNYLTKINDWFKMNCDGDWEHYEGITLETLDNPGWSLKVYILGTNIQDIKFDPVSITRNNHDWIHFRIEDDFFLGFCGVGNLEELLSTFCDIIDINK